MCECAVASDLTHTDVWKPPGRSWVWFSGLWLRGTHRG